MMNQPKSKVRVQFRFFPWNFGLDYLLVRTSAVFKFEAESITCFSSFRISIFQYLFSFGNWVWCVPSEVVRMEVTPQLVRIVAPASSKAATIWSAEPPLFQ